jgi:hypothetical protein
MTSLTLTLLALAAPAQAEKPQPAPAAPARVTVTAESACLHCTFGEGEDCAACLKLDDKTPVVLAGKAAQRFEAVRLERKVLVVEGTLTVSKDKRLTLTGADAHEWTEKDKGKAPDKGQVRVAGAACCGHCDLGLCDECTLAVKNGAFPVVLDGKLAARHAEEGKGAHTVTATGTLSRDRRGLLRLDARTVDLQKAGKDKK